MVCLISFRCHFSLITSTERYLSEGAGRQQFALSTISETAMVLACQSIGRDVWLFEVHHISFSIDCHTISSTGQSIIGEFSHVVRKMGRNLFLYSAISI